MRSRGGASANDKGTADVAPIRIQPLKLGEVALAILLLAFAFAMPFLMFPTIFVLTVVLLDRLGFTLAGKIIVLLGAVAIILFAVAVSGVFTAQTWQEDIQRFLGILRG